MPDEFNPILNNPFEEPTKYYFTESDGVLDYTQIIEGRRPFSSTTQPNPVKSGRKQQLEFINDLEVPKLEHTINILRREVGQWRKDNYSGVTRITKELLTYWFLDPFRVRKLFFAQREAIETTIWLNEIAEKSSIGSFILDQIRQGNFISELEPKMNLPRFAFKIATGGGKTVVMAMQILYHFYNRKEYTNDTRFVDYFLVLTPGITIKDRLGVLYVDNNYANAKDYYRIRDLVPHNYVDSLFELNNNIIITNRHSLECRSLKGNKISCFDGKKDTNGKKLEGIEDFDLLVKREFSKFKKGRRLLILNDEGHHCYLPKVKTKNAEDENAHAAVWYNGIVKLSEKYNLRAVYDLSATPYYISGSGYEEYSLFPWVVSDFGLVEAMESGLVKIPFLPESDTTQNISEPVLKNLYEHIKDELPKKGKQKQNLSEDPHLPTLLQNALDQFYSHYAKEYARFKEIGMFSDNPPVFIIVCNNTSLSSEVFRYLAGYEREDGAVIPGKFELFSNYDEQLKRSLSKPPTLLIDSESLEESNQITEDFKKIFEPEIERFKSDYRTFHPDRSVESLTDGDILREVVNTVGKPLSLGSHIRCVVSVSMLTEGWDANTVTHIMGIRAFGSQLLCEQVVGRALRRTNYVVSEKGKSKGKFLPEYAHVIGVPFQFFQGGKTVAPPEDVVVHQIKALSEREKDHIIHFPNVLSYRVENESDLIEADFSKVGMFEIDGTKYPMETTLGTPFSDEIRQLTLDQIKQKRKQELVYYITRSLISIKYLDYETNRRFQYFPVLKAIVEEWLDTKTVCVGDACRNMLFHYDSHKICNHIMEGIEATKRDKQQIIPILNHYNPIGSTKHVFGTTSREVYPTKKSHVNCVVADTKSWEQIAAKSMEEMPEVISYVKNSFLGFTIPYVKDDKEDKPYYPDFIARVRKKDGKIINLIIEITGRNKEDKDIKTWYVQNRWLPSVNSVRNEYPEIDNEWAFLEIADDIRFFKNKLNEFISNS
jgi:type III restriction enzyme